MEALRLPPDAAKYVADEVITARAKHYEALVYGDRFDGTPNSDYHRGEEAILRTVAERFGFEVPDDAATREAALHILVRQRPTDPTIRDFTRAIRSGQDWEGGG